MSSEDIIKKTKEQTDKIKAATPQGAADASVMQIEATVDATPQKLRRELKPFFKATKDIPAFVPAEAKIVLHALFSCFDKQRELGVQEGKVKDMVWGFEQSGIPPGCSLVGIKQLENLGFISLQNDERNKISIFSQDLPELWIKYEDKLLDLIYVGDKT
jgi:hypothetical protein